MTEPRRIDYTAMPSHDATREYRTGTSASNQQLDNIPPVHLPDDEYGRALNTFVVVCVDLLIFNPDDQVLLGRRQQEPQPDWWVIGGRMRARESYQQAAMRNARRELSLTLDPHRLSLRPLGPYSLVWDTRQQSPVDDGCHMLSLLMTYSASSEDVRAMCRNEEYADMLWFDPREVAHESRRADYHPALRKMVSDALVARSLR